MDDTEKQTAQANHPLPQVSEPASGEQNRINLAIDDTLRGSMYLEVDMK